jgi:hypothetical protein
LGERQISPDAEPLPLLLLVLSLAGFGGWLFTWKRCSSLKMKQQKIIDIEQKNVNAMR